jgi:N-acyl-D-amino-acid deacylase
MARELAGHNAMYVSHIRDEGDYLLEAVEEALEISGVSQVPLVISHHKSAGKRNWGKTRSTLEMINRARSNQTVHFDVYPYIASSSVLLTQFIETPDKVKITWSEPYPELGGVYLDKICDQWSCDLESAVQRLQPAGAIYFEMDENEMQDLLRQPQTMVGSDGLPHDPMPHPRLWGTFPRVVGYYARELGLFSVEQAIHQMTGLTASVFGLEKRGEIKSGNYADLVIFDENRILDLADFDNPIQPSAGIHSVYVNGQVVWEKGAVTGKRPGRWLERFVA